MEFAKQFRVRLPDLCKRLGGTLALLRGPDCETKPDMSAPRPFNRVRRKASRSIARKIVSNPKDAVRMLWPCLGRIEKRPYTNSMCTQ